jgi:predicted MFS family arabinose efflux permease
MTRNIRVFLLCEAILAGFGGFILPIYVLYFRYYRVTIFEVALLAAIFEAAVLVFEIPTGLAADRFGRKLSVNVGFALFAVSGLIFIVFRHLTGFIIAEILFGAAEACISGAAEALAVDSIRREDRQAILQKMYTRRSRIRIAVTTVCMISAGYAYTSSISITFYPVMVGGLLGLIASFFFGPDTSSREPVGHASFMAPFRLLIQQVRGSGILKIIFITSLVGNFAFEAVDQYWQVLLSEVFDIHPQYFGYITGAGAVLAFIFMGTIVRRFAGNIAAALLTLLIAGALISALPTFSAPVLPFMLVLYFVGKQTVAPLFSVAINSIVESTGRATFLSGYNLTCSVGEVASGVAVGVIASRLGLPVVFIVSGSLLVVTIVVSLFAGRKGIIKPLSNKPAGS